MPYHVRSKCRVRRGLSNLTAMWEPHDANWMNNSRSCWFYGMPTYPPTPPLLPTEYHSPRLDKESMRRVAMWIGFHGEQVGTKRAADDNIASTTSVPHKFRRVALESDAMQVDMWCSRRKAGIHLEIFFLSRPSRISASVSFLRSSVLLMAARGTPCRMREN